MTEYEKIRQNYDVERIVIVRLADGKLSYAARLSDGRFLTLSELPPFHQFPGYKIRQPDEFETARQKLITGMSRQRSRDRQVRYRDRNKVELVARTCDRCGTEFVPRRRTARFCSSKCRVAAHRSK